jgi:hypothetical protein
VSPTSLPGHPLPYLSFHLPTWPPVSPLDNPSPYLAINHPFLTFLCPPQSPTKKIYRHITNPRRHGVKIPEIRIKNAKTSSYFSALHRQDKK